MYYLLFYIWLNVIYLVKCIGNKTYIGKKISIQYIKYKKLSGHFNFIEINSNIISYGWL